MENNYLKKFLNNSLISIIIRSLSIFSKFVLILFLGKYFSTEEFGIFGLVQAMVSISIYLVGLDIYVFANRELAKNEKNKNLIVNNQLYIYFFSYIIFIPIIIIINKNFFFHKYLIYIPFLIVFEHFSFEIIRILIALKRIIYANCLISIRSIGWISVFIVTSLCFHNFYIEHLLLLWMIGDCIACIIGLYILKKFGIKISFKNINKKYILKFLKGAIVFFGASASIKIFEFFNRYLLKIYSTITMVGIFSFFQNICNLLDILTYAATSMIMIPKLIEYKYSKNSNYTEYLTLYQQYFICTTFIIFFLLIIIIKPILYVINKNEMINYINYFYILLGAYIFYNFSILYNNLLYINHREKFIFIANVLILIINFIISIVLIKKFNFLGAIYSFLFSSLILLALKYHFYKKIKNGN